MKSGKMLSSHLELKENAKLLERLRYFNESLGEFMNRRH